MKGQGGERDAWDATKAQADRTSSFDTHQTKKDEKKLRPEGRRTQVGEDKWAPKKEGPRDNVYGLFEAGPVKLSLPSPLPGEKFIHQTKIIAI